ncbi:hypothetical protein O6H91_10G072100 [Diphasiastrum complanatum]|uniref:Uncharacterized protein n=1 Tax=Diphasiastrum complanatum TaxID=34168 RepID=A0ACC2CI48_DIPCM|nr:hypothetical protein O6H91_10G072100 [Diphasiastrum complanatum]
MSMAEYDQPLVELLESLDNTEKVILMGHNAGGYTVTNAMGLFAEKIVVAVYISAFMGLKGFKPYQIKQTIYAHNLLASLGAMTVSR